jgi:hypothetical protein
LIFGAQLYAHLRKCARARNLGHVDTTMVEKHYGHMAASFIADAIRAGAPRFAGATDATVVPRCTSLRGDAPAVMLATKMRPVVKGPQANSCTAANRSVIRDRRRQFAQRKTQASRRGFLFERLNDRCPRIYSSSPIETWNVCG